MTPPTVTLVIPGRNCAATLDRCLQSVASLLAPTDSGVQGLEDQANGIADSSSSTEAHSSVLREIIFVNDGSTDDTPDIAARYPVRVLTGAGQGPGAARNLGWRAADSDLIWFIDSDCVAAPDALEKLLPHMLDSNVAGVGGSYSNLYPDSLIATLIHEEIVARHNRMGPEVNFLATFNVIYRREVLLHTGGFDETLKLAQDAELAFRIIAAGKRLRFENESLVGHHHPRHFRRYLRTQRRQGYYRMMLYRSHPGMMSGDSYAGILDYLQPPLGVMICLCLTLTLTTPGRVAFVLLSCLLLAFQLPMTCRLVAQNGPRMFHFLWFGSIRAISRGLGMVWGVGEIGLRALVSKEAEHAIEPSPTAEPARRRQ